MLVEPTKFWVNSVYKAVESLQNDYSRWKGMLLTEGDLECHLFRKLMETNSFKGYHKSKADTIFDNKEELYTSYVHSQVTWFKPGQKSGYEVDLTIGQPKLLEVKNIELFEEYTSKGFAYDGPCIAIELKFIRNIDKASQTAHEDYLKLRDELIPSKLENIAKGKYKISGPDNIAFFSIVGCKDDETLEKALYYLGKHLSDTKKSCPENLFFCAFSPNRIFHQKNAFIEAFQIAEVKRKLKRK